VSRPRSRSRSGRRAAGGREHAGTKQRESCATLVWYDVQPISSIALFTRCIFSFRALSFVSALTCTRTRHSSPGSMSDMEKTSLFTAVVTEPTSASSFSCWCAIVGVVKAEQLWCGPARPWKFIARAPTHVRHGVPRASWVGRAGRSVQDAPQFHRDSLNDETHRDVLVCEPFGLSVVAGEKKGEVGRDRVARAAYRKRGPAYADALRADRSAPRSFSFSSCRSESSFGADALCRMRDGGLCSMASVIHCGAHNGLHLREGSRHTRTQPRRI
jgi:hypothetical protein